MSARRMRSIAFGGAETVAFIRTILTPGDARPSAVTIAAYGEPRARAACPLRRLERLAQPQPRRDAGPDRRRPLRKGRFGPGSEARGSDARQSLSSDPRGHGPDPRNRHHGAARWDLGAGGDPGALRSRLPRPDRSVSRRSAPAGRVAPELQPPSSEPRRGGHDADEARRLGLERRQLRRSDALRRELPRGQALRSYLRRRGPLAFLLRR